MTFTQGHNCVSKLTNAYICTLIVIPRKICILWHSTLVWRLNYAWDIILMIVSMTLTVMQGDSGSAEEQIQLCMISTTKQAIQIKLAATVGHDKFYMSLKSSVPGVLVTRAYQVRHMYGVCSVSAFFPSELLVSRRKT